MQFAKKAGLMTLVFALTMGLGFSVTNDWGNTSVQVAYIEDANAKFRSSGFRSSPVRVSSFKSTSSSKSYTKSTSSKSYKSTSTTKAVAPKPKPTAFTRAASRTQAKQQAASYQSKFKRPVTKTAATSTLRSTPESTRSRLSNVNRSTYYDRRETTMNTYRSRSNVPQTVVYAGSPSYGVMDSWFFWYVVLSDPGYGYHHGSDPAYLEWKNEAKELSKDNAELRKQLEAHEAAVAKQSGDRNANYMPAGVDADVVFAPQFVEATKPVLRLCTGRTDGTYFQTGVNFKQLVGQSEVKLVATEGSVQNLSMVEKGECDAAMVQRDAYIAYGNDNPTTELSLTRLAGLYDEHVHLFCSTDSDVYNIEDMNGRKDLTMYVGDAGSGGSVTWANFTSLNDSFSGISVVNKFATENGFGKASDCGLYVGHVNSEFMKTVGTNNVRLVDIETVPTDTIRDSEGEAIYANRTINGGTYPIQRGWNDSGMFTDTPTVSVPVDVVVSDTWKSNTSTATDILNELNNLKGAVVKVL